jgi:hypothetical protein
LTRGRVHWYTKGTGHGFIKPDDGGPMAFVRREDLAAGEGLDAHDAAYVPGRFGIIGGGRLPCGEVPAALPRQP